MSMATMWLGCVLIGQALNPAPPPGAAAPARMRPPEMVAAAVQLPAGSAIVGQPYSLLSAVGSTMDRRRQIEIVRAYWRLFQTVAEYRFSLDYAQQLETIRARGVEHALLRRARAAATAQLREAELAATGAQYELAGLVRLPAAGALPLPADRPHVGAYRTLFDKLFANRTPPDGARLADKTLPLQRQVIDDRAAAVQAAEDAMQAVADESRFARGDAAATTACGRELLRQQTAFIRSVCDYNRAIADYSLTVVDLTVSPQELVKILIGPAQAATPSGAEPPASADPRRQPTPADRERRPSRDGPPRGGWTPNGARTAPSTDAGQPTAQSEPTPELPQEIPTTASRKRPADLDSASIPPLPRTAYKPFSAAPTMTVGQLCAAMFGDGKAVEGMGRPIGLTECLLRNSGGDRLGTIRAYWRLRRQMIRRQVLADQADFLDSLASAVSKHRHRPSGAADGVRWHAAQRATRADAGQSKVDLIETQYNLAIRIGAAAEAAWPLASTPARTGRYLLKLDEQPKGLVETWPLRRLTTTIDAMPDALQQCVSAVVEADAARTAMLEDYDATGASFDRVLESAAEQTQQTFEFLESLTVYNEAIAEYALAVLPPNTPADRLVKSLVVGQGRGARD
jgi:hypothetical protein